MDNKMHYQFEKEWDELFSIGILRRYRAGEVIYNQGAYDIGIYGLRHGVIRNCVYFPNGAEKTLCLLKAPSLTGETSLIDGGSSLCAAVAYTDVEVVVLSSDLANRFLDNHPKMMRLMLEIFSLKMRGIQMQTESIMLALPQRLAKMLINFRSYGVFTHSENDKRLICTHEQLAAFLGSSRPKITMALNTFERQRLIKKGRGYIEILDMPGLQALLNNQNYKNQNF